MTPAYGMELVSCHDTATVIVLVVMSFATGVVSVGLALARLGYFGAEVEQLAAEERDEDQHDHVEQFAPPTTAPDPHVPPVIRPPNAWVHREGQLPVPFNPLGESVPSRRKSS